MFRSGFLYSSHESKSVISPPRGRKSRRLFGSLLSIVGLLSLSVACDVGRVTSQLGGQNGDLEDRSVQQEALALQSQGPSQAHEAEPRRARGVAVQVAGTLLCRGCDRDQVARAIGVKARKVLPKEALELPTGLRELRSDMAKVGEKYRWTIKFRDELRVRLDPTRSEDGQTTMRARGQLDGLASLQQRYALRFVPQTDMSEADLEAFAIRAMRKSLRAQPDLGGLFWVDARYKNLDEMLEVGKALQELDSVEFVELEQIDPPPPGDIPPKTDDLSSYQRYLGEKIGVNAPWAWKKGIKGKGVRVSDCEFSWHTGHEEFTDNKLNVEKGQKLTNQYPNHGTAVMGILMAPHNGFGMNGIAPEVEGWVYPETGGRRVASVTNAIKDSKKGDIVMLEMQIRGAGGGDGPAELTKQVWMATKMGTDAGVVVIGAAGNGNQNLDSSAYSSYRERGDSGLIMVGAGSPDGRRTPLGFSTHGKRVDVQGWGRSVAATGYGALKKYGGDVNQQYTNGFSGTSSATPIVVGSASLIQSFAIAKLGKPLSSKEMRDVLKKTGTKQGSGKHIGPFPNVKAAIESLGEGEPDDEDPKVKITSPDEDLSVELEEDESVHKLRVEVDASDNSKVKEVHLEVDGEKVGDPDDEEPYVFDVELEKGKYEIRAVAVDLSDNKGSSDSVTVKVKAAASGADDDDDSTGEGVDSTSGESSKSEDPDTDDESKSEDDDDSQSAEDEDEEDPKVGTKPATPSANGGGGKAGCGCRSSAESSVFWSGAWLLLGGLALRARRRRHDG